MTRRADRNGPVFAVPQGMSRLLTGICAGVAAGFVMNQFSRAVTAATRGREGSGAAPGADRVGRGAQPPQAKTRADDDAAVKVGAAAYELATAKRPSPSKKTQLGVAAHYAFSAALGAMYAVSRERTPMISAGHGALYGAAVWAIADETVMPALGLSRSPRELGPGVLVYGLAAHLVYGISLETACANWRR